MANQGPANQVGVFTSAASAAAVTVTLGYRPAFVEFCQNSGGTNPNIYKINDAAAADRVVLDTGSTGVLTLVTNANSITISDSGFTVAAAAQTNSGTNWWLVQRK
jgi:hypothetical protein